MPIPKPERIRLKITYTIPYRGSTVRTSCSFYLTTSGGAAVPANEAAWHALANDLVLYFKTIIGDFATINEVTCYSVDSDMPVHNYSYSTAGTVTPDSNVVRVPSACAALLKWSTTQRTSKNHPIYLFNYVHGQYEYRADPDRTQQVTPLRTFSARMAASGAGISDGTNTFHKSGRYGAAAQEDVGGSWLTDHNLFT